MTKLHLAAGIFVYLALQGAVYGGDIIYRHAMDPTWPSHARYHVVVSGVHVLTLAAVTAVVAVGGLLKRRRTAWLVLALVSTLGWAAWPVARLVAGEPPPAWVLLVTSGSLIAALIALGLSFDSCFRNALDADAKD